MPIRFRCDQCQQLMAISTKRIGTEVVCARCQAVVIVPRIDVRTGEVYPLPGETQEESAPPPWDEDEPPPENPSSRTAAPQRVLRGGETLLERPDAGSEEAAAAAAPPLELGLPAAAAPLTAARPSALPAAEGFVFRRTRKQVDELDLTPMVDVTFLLLIFFMITASFSLQKTLNVPPPDDPTQGAVQSVTLEELEQKSVTLRISERGEITVDDEPIAGVEAVLPALEAARITTQKTELLVEAHDNAPHGIVVSVIDAANAAGMQRIRIASLK